MTWSKRHQKYKKIIDKNKYFEMVVGAIQSRLTLEQLRQLKLVDKDETYDLREQIFLRFVDNRYRLPSPKAEVLKCVDDFLKKYVFLLSSNLHPDKVRHIFMKAFMECVSVGSGLFFAKEDIYCDKFWMWRRVHKGTRPKQVLFRLQKRYTWNFVPFCTFIRNKYPSIPDTAACENEAMEKPNPEEWKFFSLEEMILTSYSYALTKWLVYKVLNLNGLEQELFRRLRWHLESLNQCSSVLENKYKDGVFKEISNFLGMDTDRSYFVYLTFLRTPEGDQYKKKNDLSELISTLFTEKELKLLELKDSQGNIWNFKDQIKNRYYSKYPSFVSQQEIEENIRKKMLEFRSLLNADTVEVIRDILFDEIERECFVSRDTYLWNQEMEKNIKAIDTLKCNNKVVKAIDFLISMMPGRAIEKLSLEINGRVFSLREQLLSRWCRAWLGCFHKNFQEYLSQMHIHTPYNLKSWRDKEVVSRIDLQAFLEEIDMFFLYPHQWRIIKKLLFRLDNGRVVGYENIERVKISQWGGSYDKFYGRYINITFLFSVISSCCFALLFKNY